MRSTEVAESWKPVVGYEGLYEVSSAGRVRSLDAIVPRGSGTYTRKGRHLKTSVGRNGYPEVELYKDTQRVRRGVHQLVAKAFVPNPENLPLVRHLNDVKDDNRVENLAWGTESDNRYDAYRNGRMKIRANEPTCKYGHIATEENTYLDKRGTRLCRDCQRIQSKEYKSKLKGTEPPQHGTVMGYYVYQCRCDQCLKTGREYQNEKSRLRKQKREKEEAIRNEQD